MLCYYLNVKNKKFEIKGNKVNLPDGLFSKTYRLPRGVKKTVICSTPHQSFITLDGELAELWQTIFDDEGFLNRACGYLVKNQYIEKNEARSALYGFIDQLGYPFLESSNTSAEDISTFAQAHHFLYALNIELTYRCNERCQHCYCPAGEKGREMNAKIFKKLIDEFENLGGFRLSLTGGEMLLRDDIEDILKVLIGRNIVVDIISNLTLLDDKKLDLISKIKPLRVGVTLHSAIPEIHDSITRIKGSFNRTVSSIKKLRKKGIPVLIKTVLFSKTINSYKGVKKLAAELDSSVDFSFEIVRKLNSPDDNAYLQLADKKSIHRIFTALGYLATRKEVALGKQRKLVCVSGQYMLAVSPYGDVKPCIQLIEHIGKYPEKSLAELWNGLSLRKVVSGLKMKNFKQCSKCRYLGACRMCIGSWRNKNVPDAYTCFLTKLRCKTRI